MEASVIISYYKNLPNLELVLAGLQQQTAAGNFEVIIAEDDNASETVSFIRNRQQHGSFPILHVTQEDAGFRKCRILNRAIQQSRTGLLIFLDGDCIPHKELVTEYIRNQHKGEVLYGRRVLLSQQFSASILETKDLSLLNLFSLIMGSCKRVEEGLYLPAIAGLFTGKKDGRLLGCNMAVKKEALIAINGFDEDYTAPGGGEDSDIEWRLEALGNIHFVPMKFKAIVYHLWHQERFTAAAGEKSYQALLSKIKTGFIQCRNGIQKLQRP